MSAWFRPSRPRPAAPCLIYVAIVAIGSSATISTARADAVGASARITKGPYLQALASTSVEIRAELDAPAPVSVAIGEAGETDAAAPRTVHDDAHTAMHIVRIDGLRPATHYRYTITSGSSPASAAAGELTTAPPPDATGAFSFLVYGDNRTDDASHAAIVRQMLQAPSDFILNTGDLVQDGASAANWEAFFDIERPLLRSRNVFSCVGNHELTDGAGTNYLRYFGPTTDAHGSGEPPKLYGSFRWEGARFFLLDAMETFDSGPERAWLDDELSRADAEAGLTWRIVVMHHSPWSSGPHGGNARALRAGVPALFAAHHVDLVLAGHDHIYERGFAAGLRYVVSGGGGAPLYEIETRLPSTRKAESVHHIIELTVDGDAIRLVATRDDGSVLDRCAMTKGREGWDCDPPPAPAREPVAPSNSPPTPTAKCGCSVVGASAPRSIAFLASIVAVVAALLGRVRLPRDRA